MTNNTTQHYEQEQFFSETRQVKEAFKLLQITYDSPFYFREPKGAVISGFTGVGKTTLIEQFVSQHPKYRNKDGLYVPVLSTVVPSDATVSKTITNMLRKLDVQDLTNFSENQLHQKLLVLLEECQVRMIILDEFQQLVDKKSDEVILEVWNWLKTLIVDNKIALAVVGQPSCVQVIDEDNQLKERLSMRKELSYIVTESPEDQKEYKIIMRLFERKYGLARGEITNGEMLKRFLVASHGSMRIITDVLNFDRMQNIDSPSDLSIEERLSCAFLTLHGLSQDLPVDPFKCSFAELKRVGR